MATAVGRLHELEGSDYEDAFMKEVEFFKDAQRGVDGNDVAAGLILRDEQQFELLRRLHQREIHVVVGVDEETKFEDLEFE
jgi:hypothetical protein